MLARSCNSLVFLVALASSHWSSVSEGANNYERTKRRVSNLPVAQIDLSTHTRQAEIMAFARPLLGGKALHPVEFTLAAGREAAVVGLYHQKTGSRRGRLAAVFKFVPEEREFVNELLAHNLLTTAQLKHSKPYGIISSVRLANPEGGLASLMSAAPASGLDTAMISVGRARSLPGRTRALQTAIARANALAIALAELHTTLPHRRQVSRTSRKTEVADARKKLEQGLQGLAAAGQPLTPYQRKKIWAAFSSRAKAYLRADIPGAVVHGDLLLQNVRIDKRGVTFLDLETLPRSMDRNGRGMAPAGKDLAAVVVSLRVNGQGAGLRPDEIAAITHTFLERYQRDSGLSVGQLRAQLDFLVPCRAAKTLWKIAKAVREAKMATSAQQAKQRRVLKRLLIALDVEGYDVEG